MSDDWRVTKSQFHCSRCDAEFAVGQAFYSALNETPKELTRADFCEQCWKQSPSPGNVCFWKTRRLPDGQRPRIDIEVVFDLFNTLQDADSSERRETRFVLALYLTRRKALKLVGVRRDSDRELMEFRRPRHQETFQVENPQLTEEEINSATERVKQLFQAEL